MWIDHQMAPKVRPEQPIDAADAELEVTLTSVRPGPGPMQVSTRAVRVRYPLQSGLPEAPEGGALFLGRLRILDRKTGTLYTVDLRAQGEDEDA